MLAVSGDVCRWGLHRFVACRDTAWSFDARPPGVGGGKSRVNKIINRTPEEYLAPFPYVKRVQFTSPNARDVNSYYIYLRIATGTDTYGLPVTLVVIVLKNASCNWPILVGSDPRCLNYCITSP